jgi:outer membrane protein TolC
VELPASTDNLRPETALFERQLALTEAQREFASSLNLPTISLFGQGGYGRPGLNLLLNDFEAFYIGGIRLSYVLWSGGGKTHEAAVYQIQQKQLRQQQENFLLSTRSQASRQLSEIRQLEAAIAQDAAIIDLRNQILTTSALTLENGTGTAADYTRDSNAALQAKLTRELHTIQLMLAQLDYLSTIGKTK